MDMTGEYQVGQLLLRSPRDLEQLKSFLQRHGLRYEEDIEVAFGVFGPGEQLAGCGCAAGGLLKCFAVDEPLRGQNALGLLVSHLTRNRFSAGIYNLFVITRRENETLFTACGLSVVVRTEKLAMLENRANGPETFAAQFLEPDDRGKTAGAIVMNCNPFTLGHRGLAEHAAGQCDVLHIFVLEKNRSDFPADVRYRLVREGVADLPNVRVHQGGHYIISEATFPAYFLKRDEELAMLQSELDVTLFAQRLAPVLHITKRFAGQEPLDPVTARYNKTMQRILPQYGISFCEIPRLERDGRVISASRVRKLLREQGVCREVLALVPESTGRYLQTEFRGFSK